MRAKKSVSGFVLWMLALSVGALLTFSGCPDRGGAKTEMSGSMTSEPAISEDTAESEAEKLLEEIDSL